MPRVTVLMSDGAGNTPCSVCTVLLGLAEVPGHSLDTAQGMKLRAGIQSRPALSPGHRASLLSQPLSQDGGIQTALEGGW